MVEIIARRQFDIMYIYFDIVFLLFFVGLLVYKKKYMTLLIGVLAGILYMVVDYGIFHLATGSREIFNGYSLFWVLLWMSMSYGFTNFVWIWLWLKKDKHLFEYSLLIILWWIACPLLAQTFGGFQDPIIIQRTTGAYHGYMAAILFVGYLFVIVYNLIVTRERRVNIPWILAIGILVQFAWECSLLIGGIRSAGFETFEAKMMTLVANSLLETNLGMPYMFFIFVSIAAKWNEQFKRKEQQLTMFEFIEYYNTIPSRNKYIEL